MSFLRRVRILPIGIFILSVFLFNKFIGFVFSFSEHSQTFLNHVTVAFAEAEGEKTPEDALPGGAISEEDATTGEDAAKEGGSDKGAIEKKVTKHRGLQEIILDYSNYKKPEAPPKVPFKEHYDAEEIQLLQQLREKREQLKQKEADLEEKDKLLRVTESRIIKKIEELDHLRTEIQKKINLLNDDQEKQIRSLVKTYESMKPKAAAGIFNELELAVLIEILDRMKEAKKAPILALMNSERATLVTSILATRKNIPE